MIVYTNKERTMGVIFRGMKMPNGCADCMIADKYEDYFTCLASGKTITMNPKMFVGKLTDCGLDDTDFELYSCCPHCGGSLTKMIYYNSHYYRHCLSCHFDIQIDIDKE